MKKLILMFVVAPIAALLEFFLPLTRFGPTQPPFDIAVCLTLIHLTPAGWIPTLIVGGLSANSTSVHLCRNAFWLYPTLNLTFLIGMVFAAFVSCAYGSNFNSSCRAYLSGKILG